MDTLQKFALGIAAGAALVGGSTVGLVKAEQAGRAAKRCKGGRAAAKDPQVAQTILDQLGGTGRLSAMLGAKNFIDYGDGVGFKFPNKGRGKPNHIKIVLAPDDTYTVTFSRIHGYNFKTLKAFDGIYADGLRSLIERQTGLYLNL